MSSRAVIACCNQGVVTTLNSGETTAYSGNIFGGSAMDVLYNGSMWVTIGNATVATSTDAITWTTRANHPFTASSYGVNLGWNGSYWLVCTQDFLLVKSTDGINWTALGNMSALGLTKVNRIVWNGTFWIAAIETTNNTACFVTSNGGAVWDLLENSNPFTTGCKDIKYNSSYFIASGTGSTPFAKSVDCIRWTPIPFANADSITSLSWNGSYWLAVTQLAGVKNGVAKGNVAGDAWTFDNTFIPSSVLWDGVKWVGFKDLNYYSSTDAITWTQKAGQISASITVIRNCVLESLPPTQLQSMYTRTVVGYSDENMIISINGGDVVQWVGQIFNGVATNVAYNGSMWLSVGYSYPNTLGWNIYTATSTDTINWTTHTNHPFNINSYGENMAWNGSYWLVCTNDLLMVKTVDGVDWVSLGNISSLGVLWLNRMSWVGTCWIAAVELTSNVASFIKSNDGITWILLTDSNNTINGIQYNSAYLSTFISPTVSWDGQVWLGSQDTFDYNTSDGVNWNDMVGQSAVGVISGRNSTMTMFNSAVLFPSAPTDVAVIAGNSSVSVSWTPPTNNGGAEITGYTITSSTGSTVTVGNVSSVTIFGLTNGTELTFTVVAINSAGSSVTSTEIAPVTPLSSIEPSTVPGAPTSVTAVAGNGQVDLSWTAPASNGRAVIISYTVTPSSIGGSPITVGNVTTATVASLTNGTPLTFTVTATNAIGSSSASTASSSVTPATHPDAPTSVTATAANASATVSWTAPLVTGGSVITGYRVTPSSSGVPVIVGDVLTASLTGLTNGTPLTFTVEAINSVGYSSLSTASASVTPATIPDAPTSVTAIAGNASASVSWSAPVNTGGSDITGYTVTPSSGGVPVTVGNVLTASLTGLTNGTAVTFTVKAINSVNSSLGSAASSPVTPMTNPDAPTSVTVVAGNGQVVVSWTAPLVTGGSAITGYRVTPSIGGSPVTVGNVLTASVSGLTNGTPLTFTVEAINYVGYSSLSTASSSVTPMTIPDAPTSVTAVAGNASASISWTAPLVTGGSAITGYIVTPSTGGSPTTVGNVLTASVSGLTNGTPVTFTVKAVNTVGNSLASAASSSVTPITVPDAPTGVTAVSGNASEYVSWTAPVNTGGSAIIGYTVTPSGGSPVTVGDVLFVNITGLTNGTPVTFTVSAKNAAGDSAASTASSASTPLTISDAPTNVTATAGNASASVSWTAPDNTGGAAITGYRVTPSIGGVSVTVGNVLTASVSGLTNGTPVTFTVKAINSAGDSLASLASASVTPAAVPNAPSSVTAVAGNASALVSWSAPASGGSAITGYIVTPSTGGSPVTVGNVLTASVSGLTNGTPVTFTVKAVNAVGNSLESAASSSVTPITNPDAPTSVSVTANNASATVSWTAPLVTGGSVITGYRVTPSIGGIPVTVGDVLTATVTGLTNGTPLTFTVEAINSVGYSSVSTSSASVTPMTIPDAPTSVTAVAGNGQAVVSWAAPLVTGGSDITGYTVTPSTGGSPVTVGNVLTASLTGLTNGTAITFTVKAINSVNSSLPSTASSSVTPMTNPDAPTSVSAIANNASATVSWTAPLVTGGSAITGYRVTPSSSGVPVTVGDVLTATVTGLTNGTPLTFTVEAINSVGYSSLSTASSSVTPVTVPGAPTDVIATSGNASALVQWTVPSSNGGSDITGYIVTPSTGGVSVTVGNVLSASLTGLTNGTPVTFTVKAINSVNSSLASTPSSPITPAGVPSAPTSISAVAGNGQVTVSWTAHVNTGGSAITGYRVTPSSGVPVIVGNVLTASVSGLTNGTPLTFTVEAINLVGYSSLSTASSSVTPYTVSNAPSSVTAVASVGSASVSWIAPENTGGSAITGYIVTPSSGSPVTLGNVLTASLTGLTNGTPVTFNVIAINAAGNSVSSTESPPVTPMAYVPPPTRPDAPTSVTAVAGNASASVSWTAPTNTGGALITGYTVTPSIGGVPVTVGNVLTATVTGLTNGTAVTFTVTAINSVDNSLSSEASSSVTPMTNPDAPTSVSATAGNASATVSWTAPLVTGGSVITGYRVTPSIGGIPVPVGDVLTATVTGLTNGTPLTFTVEAINSVGYSSLSTASPSVTPITRPDAPTSVTAVAGNGQVDVFWVAPLVTGGSAITGYIVTPSAGGVPVTVGNVLTASLTGLTNGTAITFTVKAINAAGNSIDSTASSSVTPATIPDAPTSLTAVAGNASVSITWDTPTNTGGSAILRYRITPSSGSPVDVENVDNVTTTTLIGLTNGIPLTFTIVAINSIGSSLASADSLSVTPTAPNTEVTVPDAPTGIHAMSGYESASVSWTAPLNNGGSEITGYTVIPSSAGGVIVGSIVTVGNVLSATVTGLTTGSSYTFKVKATNTLGNSLESTSSEPLTILPLPNAPTNISGVSGDGEVTVSWTPPLTEQGYPIIGYTVIVNPGALREVVSGNLTSTIICSLKNGSAYTFRVLSTNSIGDSLPSAASSPVTPVRAPDSPTQVSTVAGINSATVSWTTPKSNGGSSITGYIIKSYVGPYAGISVNVGVVTTTTITGLAGGVQVKFAVLAINSAGISYPSVLSLPISPTSPTVSPPSAVIGVTGLAGPSSATIRWAPPISNGGSEITGYKVICVPDNFGGVLNTTGPTSTSLTITKGIRNTIATTYTVVALNSAGQSDSVSLTSYPFPGLPVLKWSRGASGVINLIWTARAGNVSSPIVSYIVNLFSPLPAPIGMVIPTPSVSLTGGSTSISGLTNGTPYVFSVQSVSNIGPSVSKISSAMIPAGVPDVPTSFVVTKGLLSAQLTWLAPVNTGGLPITGYTITYTTGNVTGKYTVKPSLSAIKKGLINGTEYIFTIMANTLAGFSIESPSVTVIPGP